MPITQHFIIEGKYLGSTERDMVYVHSQKQVPTSYAFFCPKCAALWATCPVEVVPGQPEHFMVWTRACKRHFYHAQEVPGSLWMEWDKDFNAAFPPEVLRWELNRHLDLYKEKENVT
jgi:hypothetical protein